MTSVSSVVTELMRAVKLRIKEAAVKHQSTGGGTVTGGKVVTIEIQAPDREIVMYVYRESFETK